MKKLSIIVACLFLIVIAFAQDVKFAGDVRLPFDPTNVLSAATKQYVDELGNARLAKTGDTATDLTVSGQLNVSGAYTNNSITYITGFYGKYVSTSTNYTVQANDYMVLCNSTGATINITIPSATTYEGRILFFKKTDATGGLVKLANGTDLIDGVFTNTLTLFNQSLSIMSTGGTNWWSR